eukprot:705720-Hanusia_phi.AAC.1
MLQGLTSESPSSGPNHAAPPGQGAERPALPSSGSRPADRLVRSPGRAAPPWPRDRTQTGLPPGSLLANQGQ